MFITLHQPLVTRRAIKKFHNSENFYFTGFTGGYRFIKRETRFHYGDNERLGGFVVASFCEWDYSTNLAEKRNRNGGGVRLRQGIKGTEAKHLQSASDYLRYNLFYCYSLLDEPARISSQSHKRIVPSSPVLTSV